MTLIVARSLPIVWTCSRNLSVSCVRKDLNKQARILEKLLSNNLERKIQSTTNAVRAVKLLDKRRKAVLSKMFMSNVSQALSFGDFPEIADKGIQITRVSLTDTSRVEVFWLANEFEDPSQIQTLLSSIAGTVRNKLMYGKMMGYVPLIVFKRDLSAINCEETAMLLNKISREVEQQESRSTETYVDTLEMREELETAIPPMRLDTFGLPYNKILKMIKDAKKKSYPLQASVPPSTEEFQESLVNYGPSLNSIEAQSKRKKDLKKFVTLYQKSALNSSSRKRNLQDKDFGAFSYGVYEEQEHEQYDEKTHEFDDFLERK